MKQSIDFSSIQISLAAFFKRFHSIIFFTGLGIALAVSLYLIVGALTTTSTTSTVSTAESATFDETTINNLEESQAATDNSSTSLPSGRLNPFSE